MKALRFFCFMLLLGVVTSCSKDEDSSNVKPIDNQDYQIYSIVLNNVYGERTSALTIMQSSKSYASLHKDYKDRVIKEVPGIDKTVFDDFVNKNNQSYLFDSKFSGTAVPVILLSQEEIDNYFKLGLNEGWEAYHKKYGEGCSIIELSRIGYNAKKNQAIVEVGGNCASIAGEGLIVYLVKENNDWVVKLVYSHWVS